MASKCGVLRPPSDPSPPLPCPPPPLPRKVSATVHRARCIPLNEVVAIKRFTVDRLELDLQVRPNCPLVISHQPSAIGHR